MKNVIILAVMGLFFSVSVLAGPNQNDQVIEKKEIKQDIKELRSTQKTLNKLNYHVDLWHDANLKGDKALIKQFEVLIFDHLEKDILSNTEQIERYEAELKKSNKELYGPQPSPSSKVDDRHDFNDDKYDLATAKSLIKAKKQVLKSLKRSRSFSNRFRLLGDYSALLKKELGLGRIELAEDIREYREH